MRKYITIFILSFWISLYHPYAQGAADFKDELDMLNHINTRISAVTIEAYGCLGWTAEDRTNVAECSIKSIKELQNIREDLERINVPEDLAALKSIEQQMIEGLLSAYSGIENKNAEELAPEFLKVRRQQESLSIGLEEAYDKYGWLNDLGEDYDPVGEELSLLGDDKDRGEYLRAVEFLRDGDYDEAWGILIRLRKDYAGTPFETCAMLKISDCLILRSFGAKRGASNDGIKKGLELLYDIINRDKYSPVLFEAFYRWRTVEQYYNHGMSNWSEIPNSFYNKIRWQLIVLIKEHLAEDPSDLWAKGQVDYLVLLHNITRGGAMGNNNISDWALLYSDVPDPNQ